jgi:hypothetical protein
MKLSAKENTMLSSPVARAVRLAMVATLAACFSSVAVAQTTKEKDDVHLRNDCRLAAQTITTGHPAPKMAWALSIIFMCDESGVPAIQSMWASPPTDSVFLDQLVEASARDLDQRVYISVRTVATNTGSPLGLRIAALRVLASFVDASKFYYPANLLRPSPDSSLTILDDSGLLQVVGSQPLAAGVNADITALFAALAQGDPDPLLRFAARHLAPVIH